MTGPVLQVERLGRVLLLRLNRPEVKNAVDQELSQALDEGFRLLDAEADLAVAVVAGGKDFSAGMDLRGFSRGDSVEVEGRGLGGLTRTPPRKPVIAAVEGYALAGGFEMVLACDLVIAARSARFGLPEVKRGLVAGSGGLIRLARQLPQSVVAELALTGRMLSSEEMERWGLVTEVVDDRMAVSRALAVAAELAVSSAYALAATKRILQAGAELPAAQAWEIQDEVLAAVLASADAAEGAAAFIAKREPRWIGR